MDSDKTIGYISIYPPKGSLHGSGASGVGSYTKNLVTNLSEKIQKEIVIFCDYEAIVNPKDKYQEGNIYIDRCRTRKGVYSFVSQIIHNLQKYPKLKTIHIQHEFNMFGSIWTIAFVQILLIALKIKGIKIVITFHGLSSPDIIDTEYCEINLLPWYLPSWIIKFCFLTFYRISKFTLDTIIVHEEYFQKILIKKYGYNPNNIKVIHHGIEKLSSTISKDQACKKLGIPLDKKVLLYFGFIAGYKGVELLLDGFDKLDEEYHLIIAGGIPKRTAKDPKFMERYAKLESRISGIQNITRIGFVPDEDIQTIYTASDLLVIPYIYMLAASGPMSLSIAYGLPFVVSKAFDSVIDNKSIIFDTNSDDLAKCIQDNISHKEENHIYIKQLQETRSRYKIANQTEKLYI